MSVITPVTAVALTNVPVTVTVTPGEALAGLTVALDEKLGTGVAVGAGVAVAVGAGVGEAVGAGVGGAVGGGGRGAVGGRPCGARGPRVRDRGGGGKNGGAAPQYDTPHPRHNQPHL